MNLELASVVGVVAAMLALLAHIVLTLRAIHAEVRKIQRDLEEKQ